MKSLKCKLGFHNWECNLIDLFPTGSYPDPKTMNRKEFEDFVIEAKQFLKQAKPTGKVPFFICTECGNPNMKLNVLLLKAIFVPEEK